MNTRWFFVTFSSPNWRWLNHLKRSLNHPKKVTKNCQEQVVCWKKRSFFSVWIQCCGHLLIWTPKKSSSIFCSDRKFPEVQLLENGSESSRSSPLIIRLWKGKGLVLEGFSPSKMGRGQLGSRYLVIQFVTFWSPKRWRSRFAFEFGSRFHSPSQKGHKLAELPGFWGRLKIHKNTWRLPGFISGKSHEGAKMPPGCLWYIGDDELPSYMGIIINHYISGSLLTNQYNGK